MSFVFSLPLLNILYFSFLSFFFIPIDAGFNTVGGGKIEKKNQIDCISFSTFSTLALVDSPLIRSSSSRRVMYAHTHTQGALSLITTEMKKKKLLSFFLSFHWIVCYYYYFFLLGAD